MDFDSSLGYPGEGPQSCWICLLPFWTFALLAEGLPIFLHEGNIFRGIVSGHLILICHGVSEPIANAGDRVRQRAREGLVLDDGRPMTAGTKATREELLVHLEAWLNGKGKTFGAVFLSQPPDFDEINRVLTDYGRMLFRLGKAYYKYAETLNGVTSRRPILRRSIGAAWDLAFMCWNSLI